MAPGDRMADNLDRKAQNSSPAPGVPADSPDLAALAKWAPELARTFVALASDIALVIDGSGVIRNVAQPNAEPLSPGACQWVGRPWVDTVSGSSRSKIAHLLDEVLETGVSRRREVSLPLQSGPDIPVAYTAIRLGEHGPVLAVGRDLRAIAAIQQRYIEAQQDLERGYWGARQDEARYRLLFQVATDAVLVVDPESMRIVEANQAAALLFDIAAEQLSGRDAALGFEPHSRSAVTELLNRARASGQSGEIRARLSGSVRFASVSATSLRVGETMRLLVRVRRIDDTTSGTALSKALSRLVDDSRDGVVVTDSAGRILVANPAFVVLTGLAGESEARGEALVDWLVPEGRPLTALLAQIRRNGIVHRAASRVVPVGGKAVAVEVSAALLTEGDQECLGFTIHPAVADAPAPTLPAATPESTLPTASLAGLQTELAHLDAQIGALPLCQLQQRAAVIAERHFLQSAMQRAEGDPEVAAGLLGVTREHLAQRRAKTMTGPDPDLDLESA